MRMRKTEHIGKYDVMLYAMEDVDKCWGKICRDVLDVTGATLIGLIKTGSVWGYDVLEFEVRSKDRFDLEWVRNLINEMYFVHDCCFISDERVVSKTKKR